MDRRYRAEQYPGLMTADPPICAMGPALAVLRRCERLRRGKEGRLEHALHEVEVERLALGLALRLRDGGFDGFDGFVGHGQVIVSGARSLVRRT